MAEAKICGIKDAGGLDAALVGGARFIGLVFFPKSPRHLSFEAAASLAARARGRAEIVAVTVDADDGLLSAIAEAVRPDWVQLHGRESAERVEVAKRFVGRGVIKAISVAEASDFEAVSRFELVADMLMFDAKAPPGATLPGGNGAAFDWALLSGRKINRPWMLSGGLSPDNVGQAIALSGADLVDVSSGVEAAPGVKDPERIAAFLAAAKAAG